MKMNLMKYVVVVGGIAISVAVLFGLYLNASDRNPSETQSDGNVPDIPFAISPKHNVLEELRPDFNALRIGESVRSITLETIHDKKFSLDELVKRGPVALIFISSRCPVVQRYTHRLNRLHKKFSPQGVSIIAVSSNEDESRSRLIEYTLERGYQFPVVKEADGQLARLLGAAMTPQVFVVDQQKVLRYRGAIDDDRYENRVKNHYLQNTLTALLQAKQVPIASTRSFGCTVHLPEERSSFVETVTYSEHIASILQENCQSCHRPGQVGPFSLVTYEDAEAWATEIGYYTKARLMPPWKPMPGFGEFKKVRGLSHEEISLINRWVETGTPAGDLDMVPPPPTFPSEWALGEPDAILEMPQEYEVGPEGADEYRNFVIPTNFDRDMYVQAMDLQPGNRNVVHHALVIADESGYSRKRDAADPKPGYAKIMSEDADPKPSSRMQRLKTRLRRIVSGPKQKSKKKRQSMFLGGWLPGTTPSVFPRGVGTLLPKGSDVVLMIHYYRTGKTEKDRSRVGLYFLKETHTARIYTKTISARTFTIPAGAERFEVLPRGTLQADNYLMAIIPHMHFLGREMKVTAKLPNKDEEIPLVWIKNWDFNWQDIYHYKKPFFLPRGTEVRINAYFDNSAGNRLNPNDPPKPVSYGYNSVDEMCAARLMFVKASEYNLAKEVYSAMNTNTN